MNMINSMKSLTFLERENANKNSKRVLQAVTAHNRCLK